MKIGICTDSGSGIRKEESEIFGITVVPMPFRMGDQEYFEGINMSRELFLKSWQRERKCPLPSPPWKA